MVKLNSNLSHLFLDLDGTLVNSLPKLRHIYQDFLSEHQIQGSDEEFSQLKTSSIEKCIEYFKIKYSLNYPPHSLKKKYEQYLQKYYLRAPLFQGVKEFLKKVEEEEGITFILTTANQKKSADKILKFHKIAHHIKDIYTPNCFNVLQKDAEFYQKVLDHLQLKPENVLVIDDSIEAVASSTEIGMNALLFSKVPTHPLPSFGSWKYLSKLWPAYVTQ